MGNSSTASTLAAFLSLAVIACSSAPEPTAPASEPSLPAPAPAVAAPTTAASDPTPPADGNLATQPSTAAQDEPGVDGFIEGEGGTLLRYVETEHACQSDADCVPAGCCHPTTCVPPGQASKCEGTMCTHECRQETLDCGGGCLCRQGKCTAKVFFTYRTGPPNPDK